MRLTLLKSNKSIVGFDDRPFLLIGIPVIALMVEIILFGADIFSDDKASPLVCYGVSLYYTFFFWIAFRQAFVYLTRKMPGDHEVRKRQIFTSLLGILGFFVLDLVLSGFLVLIADPLAADKESPNFVVKSITSLVFTLLIMSFYESLYLAVKIGKHALEKEKLLRENTLSQLAGLRAQINPHFLFNSLNTLSQLIYEDAQKAEQYVLKMAMVYRHMLDESGETLTLLSQELKYIGAYQFLLNERFGDAIQFVEEIPQDALLRYVVPLGLQIVIENCVKHNAATADQPLTIHMYISNQGDYLCVDNNILPKPGIIDSPGLGLKNIQRRYAFFTTQPVTTHQEGGKFKVCLPLLVSKEIVK